MERFSTILVQACLNGGRSRNDHPRVPITAYELADSARSAVMVGAAALHVHQRGPTGEETLDAKACAAVVSAIRVACPGVPLGLTTGAWIEPDPERRIQLVREWSELPDYASANVSEEGSIELIRALVELGVGVEAGVVGLTDARSLIESGLAERCLRILVEVEEVDPREAVAAASEIGSSLRDAGVRTPQLHHGYHAATWPVIDAAIQAGHDVRIGLEDTLALADGRPADGNSDLVAQVVRMAQRNGRDPLRPDRSAEPPT